MEIDLNGSNPFYDKEKSFGARGAPGYKIFGNGRKTGLLDGNPAGLPLHCGMIGP